MKPVPLRQGELFGSDPSGCCAADRPAPLPPPLLRHQLLDWQQRLAAHQGPLFRACAGTGAVSGESAGAGTGAGTMTAGGDGSGALWGQASLFPTAAAADPAERAARLDPLALQPQSLAFWRWPQAPQQGAAIYLVMDRPAAGDGALLDGALLLYVGETGCADRRWKGEHDCKRYLASYSEALRCAGLPTALSIRFWCDVPTAVRARRALEQALIRRWWPPFNKETRERWATPFTADPD